MSVEVRELLKLDIYNKNCQVLVEEGLDRKVRYLTVMEAPDFHFETIEDETMILTTLSSHHKSIKEINNIILQLCEANVAAIAIKVGRFVDHIDPSTISICETYKTALLSFNNRIFFREVLSESLAFIANRQYFFMENLISFENELSNIILKDESIDKVINLFIKKIKAICLVFDTELNLLARENSLGFDLNPENIKEKIKKIDDDFCFLKDNEVIIKCKSVSDHAGYIYIKAGEALNNENFAYVKAISRTASICLINRSLEEKTKSKLIEFLLDDILFSGSLDEELTKNRLSLFGFTPKKYHALILICKKNKETMTNRDVTAVQNCLINYLDAVITFKQDKYLLVILSCEQIKNIQEYKKYITKALNMAIGELAEQCYIGCSSFTQSFAEMANCYKQGKQAIQFGKTIHLDADLFFYNDYLDLGLVSYALNTNASNEFKERIIKPIFDYDQKHKAKLWSTLAKCLTGQTLEEVSKELYIHISTLRYRLAKIEILTGYNFFDQQEKMSLYLAYLLYVAEETQKS